jgi:Na+/proline symporter/signal transduction histidine kinase
MLDANVVILVCLVYVAILFGVAFAGDRQARRGPAGWLSSPLVYTLSISIYCTSWTFFGAVGSAARHGLEFATIYLGPTIVFVGWWLLLRKLVTVGRIQRTTSIADFISARFGKSSALGALVTIVAVVASTPYIALQLKALTDGFQVLTYPRGSMVAASIELAPDYVLAFWIAAGLCVFSIIFGVRNIDVNERHHGVVAAIALEAVVKLFAMVMLGLWVVQSVDGGLPEIFSRVPTNLSDPAETFGGRWIALMFLAGAAVICLPRQFQVTVVENSNDRQLRTASWLFPLYLLLLCLFVLPIALAGLQRLPSGSNPDLFVLTLPLESRQNALALVAYLGGFSSATSMVIMSSIAVSTMISNHIVMPLALRFSLLPQSGPQNVRRFILFTRRCAVVFILALGVVYLRWSASEALAAIGLISFCGVAQFLPSLVGGLYWRRATAGGALAGLIAGLAIWLYTLFLPSFGSSLFMSADMLAHGPFGVGWLRPHELFGLRGFDPLVPAVFWSMLFNVTIFVFVSLMSEPSPLAQVQSTLFVDVFRRQTEGEQRVIRRTASIPDLRRIGDRVLGPSESLQLLGRGRGHGAIASDELISQLEQRIAGHVGAASARALVSQVVIDETISVEELKRLADEAEQIRAYSAELERKSRQLEATAAELAAANERLREIDKQKDEFLSQVSHEVRTPMTSIRSFSDILLSDRAIPEDRRQRFLGIIQTESIRLTRLLDSILEPSRQRELERSGTAISFDPVAILMQAVESCEALAHSADVELRVEQSGSSVRLHGNPDRLAQVFINLISNAIKYNSAADPVVTVTSAAIGDANEVRVADNGPGIAWEDRERIFDKFERGSTQGKGGVGLGLAIARQIVQGFGGQLYLERREAPGATFVVRLPSGNAGCPA